MANKWIGTIDKLYDNKEKKVRKITFKFLVQDIKGEASITNIMLQGGSNCTGWMPNTQEMFINDTKTKHYNCFVRGGDKVIIPSNSDVTGGMDIQLKTYEGINGEDYSVKLSTEYYTKDLYYYNALNAGDTLSIQSNYQIKHNSVLRNKNKDYNGNPLMNPSGHTIYNVSLINQSSARLTINFNEWNKSKVSW